MGARSSTLHPSKGRVEIAVEQQLYHAGELVRGYVDVRIKEEMPLRSCSAILSGTAHTRVRYTQSNGNGGSHTRTAKEAHRVLCLQSPVTNFSGGVVRPGHTQYPFEFTIPKDAVTSVAYGRQFDLTYAFHSRVTRKSIDALKEFFKEDVAKEDWQLLLRLKKMFGVL